MTPAATLDEERLARVRLASVPGVRADRLLGLIAACGGARELLRLDATTLAATGCVSRQTAERLLATARAFDADKELANALKTDIRLLFLEDAELPDLLKSIPDPPILLYCLGRLEPERTALAVVGSRKPTPYGARMARSFSRDAAAAGWAVVSGLARGVDTEAHRAALDAGGVTWAVLGGGLSRLYPPENWPLAKRIAEKGGAVLSEFPLQAPPLQENFPRRNRLISGLCAATLVVEGAETSGSLITAKLALEQGREVFAVPGPADSPMSRGPNRLIQDGAALASTWEDIRPALAAGGAREARTAPAPLPLAEVSPEERPILERLAGEPALLEDLAVELGRETHVLSRELLDLELRGLVVSLGAQRYALK